MLEPQEGPGGGPFGMFAGVSTEGLPEKLTELEKKGLASSALQGMVGPDGNVRFCGLFTEDRGKRLRRDNLSETERGRELAVYKVRVPGQGDRDDLEAIDVSVYRLPAATDPVRRATDELRDRRVARFRGDEEEARRLRAWTLFRERKDREVLDELAPL